MEDVSTTGFLCREGWEETLAREIAACDPAATPVSPAPGFVVCPPAPGRPLQDLTFALQWLPNAIEVSAPSIKTIVQAIGQFADRAVGTAQEPWSFRAFTPDAYTLGGEVHRRLWPRARRIGDAFLARMRTYRRRTFERFCAEPEDEAGESRVLLQVLLVRRNRAWLSASDRLTLRGGRRVPVLWPGGPRVPEDPRAPSRSSFKIEEAWLEAGCAPSAGDVCVDLGAAPGGWTYAALKRGARVYAIDAADLAPIVEGHPLCEHRRDNGYSFLPERRVDWLLCDMIVRPLATLGLLERWLAARACSRFVVNVKFRGKDPATILGAAASVAQRHCLADFAVRQLYYDRNEVTLIGRLR
jgi:23S rRNA (cytidine2498-2'-O)-methyltransferase